VAVAESWYVRSSYARYFAEENPLPWQWQKVGMVI